MNPSVVEYYDQLADRYDVDRFTNSYGMFVDAQERQLLHRFLPTDAAPVLDVCCGTGRLTDRAMVGCDASLRSLHVAARRRASALFAAADASQLPFADESFHGAIAFHVFMHLELAEIQAIFAEVARVLKRGGIFVADVASERRRRLNGKSISGWHGATALSASAFSDCGVTAGLQLSSLSASSPDHSAG